MYYVIPRLPASRVLSFPQTPSGFDGTRILNSVEAGGLRIVKIRPTRVQ